MFLLAVVLTTLAVLFMLTTLALSEAGALRHPVRVAAALAALLVVALALLAD